MAHFSIQSPAEQLAAHLREQLGNGVWTGTMPGTIKLAADLGLDRRVVIEALKLLEHEGLVESQGNGLPRRIVSAKAASEGSPLKISVLLYEAADMQDHYITDLVHQLQAAGHQASYAARTMTSLGMETERIAKMVEKSAADAWVILAGSSDVLEWFSQQDFPAFALFGRHTKFPIASVNAERLPMMRAMVRQLHQLGHRRMVKIAREERRKPEPGRVERAFLSELESLGVQTGPYNLPDWEDTVQGLHQCIESLFRHTPPTALLIGEPRLFLSVRQQLSDQGIIAPRDISMICMDPSTAFDWFHPAVSHVTWDYKPWIRRVVKWAENVAMGKEDRKKTVTKVSFVEGSTIGPAPTS